jgi:sigma-B regulation protein RsbU (phosphoserine phosphatase)
LFEAELSSSRSAPVEDFADTFDHAPCGYLTTTADGRITRVNATFSRWTGFSQSQLLDKRVRDLLTVSGRILYETNVAPLLRLRAGFEEVALDLVTASGQIVHMLVNAEGDREEDGALKAARIVFFRAGDRRKYERDLQGREAAAVRNLLDERAASELREQFIAVLGHDLRNPLASIAGAAHLLRREAQSDKALGVIGLMEASVGRMTGLIEDVMDFARASLGSGIGLNRKIARLEPLLRHVAAELEASHPNLVIVCDFDLPDPISFDEGRIAQLVSNLLGNALTHGAPGRPIGLHAAHQDGQLKLWVSNAGEPIAPTAMERLFQPFFRGEVRASQQGLGLGLHIASEIARAHGGALQVQSDAVETRFTLTMPAD